MKVLNISSFDLSGGAARAAYRVHDGLNNIGVDSQMLVRIKSSDDNKVISTSRTLLGKVVGRLKAELDFLPLKQYIQHNVPKRNTYSLQWVPDWIAPQVAQINPDIINLHWVCDGYLKVETLEKFHKPIVWTLMDMWPFTGGCHYSEGCLRYLDTCGTCPQLHSHKEADLSRQIWQRKVKAWKNLNLTIVTPSSWLANCARSSSLFKNHRVEVIPFALNTQTYKPVDKKVARAILNLPPDKHLVLFGAINATQDQRKGFHLLQAALKTLSQSEWSDKIYLNIFGSSQPEKPVDLGFETIYQGKLNQDILLALVYSAADLMVVPSIEEAFGQTASESLACGTPVVAFSGTGVADIVDHQQNGYLAKPYEIEDLARGIAWVLEDKDRHQELCIQARLKAEREYSLEIQAQRYLSLFTDILAGQEASVMMRNSGIN